MTLSIEQWERVLEDASPTTHGEIVATLEEKDRDLLPDEPEQLVEDAIADGLLEPADANCSFPTYRVDHAEGGGGDAMEPGDRDPNPGLEGEEIGSRKAISRGEAVDALNDAVSFFHAQLDRDVDGLDGGAETPREYLRDVRGWADETIDAKRLGWAPANRTALLEHLMGEGHGRDAILATGLFWENGLEPIWKGRLVLPYLVKDRATFAISRRVGAEGHPDDDAGAYGDDETPAKYHKIPDQDRTVVDEPIYGVDSLEDGEVVLVTEGIADAITAHEAGYACLSPVTTQFKHAHREELVEILTERDVGRVFVVQDAESPTSDLVEDAEGWDALTVTQFGEGVQGATTTGGYLADNGIDARVGELPQPGAEKIDLDDYLQGWAETLGPVLASALPAAQHPAYDPQEAAVDAAERERESLANRTGDDGTALFDLDLLDVAGIGRDYRGVNPLGHHGESENYFTVLGDGELGFDHKHKAAYNALTYLLVEAGERHASAPNGPVGNDELLAVWVHAKRQGHLGADDPVPHAALRHLATDRGLCDRDELGDGWRIPLDAHNGALELLEDEFGVAPGRDPLSGRGDRDDETPAVTFDPAIAWRAASTVTPDDLEGGPDLELTADGQGWRCPVTGERVDVVRAVAIDEDLLDRGDATFPDGEYHTAYRIARERYDAPLPEYVTAATATDRWAVIQGALEQLTHRHFSAIKSDVTGLGQDSRTVGVINPCWTYSASGERVIALENGAFYCRKHERVLDPLRFVALETGIMAHCEDSLEGQAFIDAYHAAREEYGAPLPKWSVGDPDHVPVLPPADELVGEFETDYESLEQAREDVEALYRDLADDERTPHVLNALPALGKTTSVVKNAEEYPALYLAPRKELQEDVMEKALTYGIDAQYLPVFAERQVSTAAMNQALAIVREEGKDVLEDREALLERIDAPIFEDEDPDNVELRRDSCPVANGDHGEGWALAVQVARELGHEPREILTNGRALFGDELPIEPDEDPYSQAWDRVSDPEAPIDLLIGSYGHAYVGGARTYYHKRDGETARDPRVVAVDEFPDLDPFETQFGERYLDHAVWLARALRDDVADRQDFFEAELWEDEWVRRWLEGNGTDLPGLKRARRALRAMQDVLGAVEGAEDLLDARRDCARSLGLEGPLQDTVESHPTWEPDETRDAMTALSRGVRDATPKGEAENVLCSRVADEVIPALEAYLATADELPVEELAANTVPDEASGDLLDMCRTACELFADRQDGAEAVLEATAEALKGGREGCRALALHSGDGYSHPDATLLLFGQIADGERATTVSTENYTFGNDGGTNVKRAELDGATILVDRDHGGAAVHAPPEFQPNGTGRNPVVGLDATANERLWSRALGLDVEIADIHDSPADRRTFLEDVLNLQVLQTSPHIKSYNNLASKNLDGDVELVRSVADEYGGAGQLRQDTLTTPTKPGVITTKQAEAEIADRVADCTAEIDHYGNVTGSNAMGRCNLGVVLGANHYGDVSVEKWAAYAGEQVDRQGHGVELDYRSETANAMLEHMLEDETMQAILRFGRDEEGAIVFAHTAALRDDLPVVAEGDVVQAHSKSAKAVARAAARIETRSFTVDDLVDDVDCSRRTIRRVLAGFAEAGYLSRAETGEGLANQYRQVSDPGLGSVDLPDLGLDREADPADTPLSELYTWNVRVRGGDRRAYHTDRVAGSTLPAPGVGGPGRSPG